MEMKSTNLTACHCRMRVHAPALAREARPGQFVEVRCSERGETLLRRPFGVHRILRDGIEMLYEVVGKGTTLLALKKAGDEVDIIGPLGNGFSVGSRAGIRRANSEGQGTRVEVLVAGGIGVAPMVALAEKIAASGKGQGARKKQRTIVLIGARTKSHVVCAGDFKKLGAKVVVTTDDGSLGTKGFVTEPLKKALAAAGNGITAVYACGPTPMLKVVAALAREHHVPCQVSLEEHMACGVGVCLGCPVKVRKDLVETEYKMVCKDGPVFDAEQVVW